MTDEITSDQDNTPSSTPIKLLDHTVLLQVVDGDEDLLRAVSALFLRTYPTALSDIRDCVARNDGSGVARAAHTLKGSGGHFLTDAARTVVTDLEVIGLGGDMKNAASRLVDLEAEMERIRIELSTLAGETRDA